MHTAFGGGGGGGEDNTFLNNFTHLNVLGMVRSSSRPFNYGSCLYVYTKTEQTDIQLL